MSFRVLSVIFTGILFLFSMFSFSSEINEGFDNYDYFFVSINSSLSEPIVIQDIFVVDYKKEKPSGESILINNNTIYFPSYLWGHKSINITKFKDIKANSESFSDLIRALLILLLPGLLLFMYVLSFIKISIIVIVLSALFWIILYFLRRSISFINLLKIGFYASTILMIYIILSPVVSVLFVCVLLFLLLFFYSSHICSDKRG